MGALFPGLTASTRGRWRQITESAIRHMGDSLVRLAPGQNSQVRPKEGRMGRSVSPGLGVTLPPGRSIA